MRELTLLPFLLTACATSHPVTTPTPERAAKLTLGVDTHLHLTMSQAAKPIFTGEPGDGVLATNPRTKIVNQVTEAQLHHSGVRLVFAALWPPWRTRAGLSSLDLSVKQARELDDFVARRPGFGLATDATSARRVLASGRIAVVPQLEGGEGIERVEDVDALYAAGVRVVTVVHFVSTQLGGAAKGQLSRALFQGTPGERETEGLTPLGREVVTRMMQLGMVIDVAHGSDRLVSDVLDLTEPLGVPVLISHTSSRAMLDFERASPDGLVQRVAKSGGLIGVTLSDKQVETDAAHRLPAHQPGTCDDVVAHWKHLASIVPPEALVLGSDMNGFISRPAPGGLCPDGLRHYGDVNQLWAALVQAGLPRAALDGMGERLLQLMEKVDAHADPDAQAEAKRRFTRVRDEASALR